MAGRVRLCLAAMTMWGGLIPVCVSVGYVGGPFPVYRPVPSRPVPSRPVASSRVGWMCIREMLFLLPVGLPIWGKMWAVARPWDHVYLARKMWTIKEINHY